jgi:hypothetical protein
MDDFTMYSDFFYKFRKFIFSLKKMHWN